MSAITAAVPTMIMTASLAATVMLSALPSPPALLATTGLVAFLWAFLAIRDRRALLEQAATRSRVGAVTARYMGLVWLWGALGIALTYLLVLDWREWWQFAIGFAVVGALCLAYSAMLGRDADVGREDETLLRLGRYLAIGQLGGMAVAVIGLIVDPDKEFLWPNEGDWAANILFLGGALALAAITMHALVYDEKPGQKVRA